VAELQVVIESAGAKAGAKAVVRSLKEIKRATAANEGQFVKATRAGVAYGKSTAAAAKASAAAQNIMTAAIGRSQARLAALAAQNAAGGGVFGRIALGARNATAELGKQLTMTRRVSAGFKLMGLAAVAAFAFAIKRSLEFEETMSRITGLVGIAADEVKAFEQPLLDISKATTKGPAELAEALFFITSAGARGTKAIEILEASARAAAAGLGETKIVADAVTSAVNAYGESALTAAQSTDVLTATVKEGKAEADSIAGAMGRVLPIAQQMGVTFDQVGATVAALTRVGLDAAESTTALRATLALLNKPGSEAVRTLKRLSEQNLGVEVTFDDIRRVLREDGLIAALQLMKEAVGGNDQELTKLIPNLRANAGVFALLGENLEANIQIFKNLKNSVGAADDAFSAFEETNQFLVKKSLNDLRVDMKLVADELLPAVAKAFGVVSNAITGTINAFKALGASIAEAISGNADPLVRALNRQKEIRDAIDQFTSKAQTVTTILEDGSRVVSQIRVPLNQFDKWIIKQTGINQAGVELTGTYEEQLAQLRAALATQDIIVNQTNKEIGQRQEVARLAREAADAAADEAAQVDKKPVKVIDVALLNEGKEALKDLREETAFLITDLGTLTSLGKKGIGVAEDAQLAADVFKALQGEVALSKDEIVELVRQKRALESAIEAVTEAFERQDAANETIKDLELSTANLAEKLRAAAGGESIVDVDSLQQARAIMKDLGTDTDFTVESVKALIDEERILNDAIGSFDVTKVDLLKDKLAGIVALAAVTTDENVLDFLSRSADNLRGSILDAELAALGLGNLDDIVLDSLPKAEQFAIQSQKLKDAFNLAGIIDPNDPRFVAALEALEAKIKGTSDIFEEFAIQAARNIQSSFADFLFDPFTEGLDGLARNFGETLRRMAAELLSQQILKSFFSSLGGAGGGIFQTLAGSFADGGDFTGNKPILVGEDGPEVITPRASGTVVPNGAMQQAAPVVNVSPAPVVVVDDPRKVEQALQSATGQRALVDAIANKRGSIKEVLS